MIGKRVIVHKHQNRLGPPKCPGRTGEIIKISGIDENHVYVRLEPTARAKEKVETFWLEDLIILDDEPQEPPCKH